MQYPRKPRSSRPWYFIGGALALVILLGICGSTLYRQQFEGLLRNLEPSCVLGTGTVTITVQAWSANDDCLAMRAGDDTFTGVNWAQLGLTPVSEANGTILCEMDMSGRHITVRDSDLLSNRGSVICGMFNPILPLPGN